MTTIKHAQVEIRNKKMINEALYVMECPKCGRIAASASERYLLPEFTTCKGASESEFVPSKKSNTVKEYVPVTLGVGSTVEHRHFGKGVILTEDEKRVDIDFETEGKKNLLKQFADLKLVNNA